MVRWRSVIGPLGFLLIVGVEFGFGPGWTHLVQLTSKTKTCKPTPLKIPSQSSPLGPTRMPLSSSPH